jgi:predicted nucleotidyltransferase
MRREQALKLLRAHKRYLEERYGITRLGIFGSVARDEAVNSSDVDVVVEMAPDMFARASLKEELKTILRTNVDVVRYWQRMNHYPKRRIDREAYYV